MEQYDHFAPTFERALRVMIVEDEPATALALALAVTRAGHVVVATTEADEAARRLHTCDIVIVAEQVGDTRGTDLLRVAARLQPRALRCLLASQLTRALVDRARDDGVVDYVLGMHTLERAVSRLLDEVVRMKAGESPDGDPSTWIDCDVNE